MIPKFRTCLGRLLHLKEQAQLRYTDTVLQKNLCAKRWTGYKASKLNWHMKGLGSEEKSHPRPQPIHPL